MGCTSSITSSTAVKPAEQIENNNHHHHTHSNNSNVIFTVEERLKLKEIWIIIKHNDFKKLGEEIMSRALDKNSSLIKYWQNVAILEQGNSLNFGENDSRLNNEFLWKLAYIQHGYQMLDKIDQLIMLMVTRINTNDIDDSILNEYFHRIAQPHIKCKIKQDHIDVLSECFLECLKTVMYHSEAEWTIKHELAWMKLFSLVTNQFCPVSTSNSGKMT